MFLASDKLKDEISFLSLSKIPDTSVDENNFVYNINPAAVSAFIL